MSAPVVEPYLSFGGRCEEAINFYVKALGAKVNAIMRFSDSPEPIPQEHYTPGMETKVMHASFTIGRSTVMATDGCGEKPGFNGFSLSYTVTDVADADRAFSALADGGTVTMPLAKTFWSPRFGMLTDRFGVTWMIMTLSENCNK